VRKQQWQNQIKDLSRWKELLVSRLAQTDALAKLLIENGLITEKSLCRRFQRNGATYQKLLNPTVQ
jgi:hypothetical protein